MNNNLFHAGKVMKGIKNSILTVLQEDPENDVKKLFQNFQDEVGNFFERNLISDPYGKISVSEVYREYIAKTSGLFANIGIADFAKILVKNDKKIAASCDFDGSILVANIFLTGFRWKNEQTKKMMDLVESKNEQSF